MITVSSLPNFTVSQGRLDETAQLLASKACDQALKVLIECAVQYQRDKPERSTILPQLLRVQKKKQRRQAEQAKADAGADAADDEMGEALDDMEEEGDVDDAESGDEDDADVVDANLQAQLCLALKSGDSSRVNELLGPYLQQRAPVDASSLIADIMQLYPSLLVATADRLPEHALRLMAQQFFVKIGAQEQVCHVNHVVDNLLGFVYKLNPFRAFHHSLFQFWQIEEASNSAVIQTGLSTRKQDLFARQLRPIGQDIGLRLCVSSSFTSKRVQKSIEQLRIRHTGQDEVPFVSAGAHISVLEVIQRFAGHPRGQQLIQQVRRTFQAGSLHHTASMYNIFKLSECCSCLLFQLFFQDLTNQYTCCLQPSPTRSTPTTSKTSPQL